MRGRVPYGRLVEAAVEGEQLVGVFTQREASVEEPGRDDLYGIGTITHIHKMFKLPDGSLRLIVQGLARVTLDGITAAEPFLRAAVRAAEEVVSEDDRLEVDALQRNIKNNFQQVVSLSPLLSDELQALSGNISEPGKLADFIASSLATLATDARQQVLETLDVRARLDHLNRILVKEIEVLELGSKIQSEVQSEMGKSQREYLLREQLKAIRKELGENDDQAKEIEELRQKIQAAGMPEASLKEALRELDRLSRMPVAAAEYTVSRTYIDWLIALPWNQRTEEKIDLARTRETLDSDHSGLEKAKDRILEYLAVRKLNPGVKGPILCFVGPPGVGKTSLAKGIAASMDRKFVRVSLGGMRDEAEKSAAIGGPTSARCRVRSCRGSAGPSRRTRCSSSTKSTSWGWTSGATRLPRSWRCSIPSRTRRCRDHYVDLPFDLSEVLFITTANVLDPIPPALRDRMEVLECSSCRGTQEEEKLLIATEHLLGRQIENHGLTAEQVRFTEEALRAVIRGYTREAGVRNLEREIGALCRKVARRRAEGDESPVEIGADVVVEMLGAPKHLDEEVAQRTRRPGVAIGLAWTPVGGDVLFVESRRMSGSGTLTLTGHLGDVMKESARAALSWLRANASRYDVDPAFYGEAEVHLHVPSGAIPKDGPSAGVTMVAALVSELTGRPVRGDLAMTGEITLSGNVLPGRRHQGEGAGRAPARDRRGRPAEAEREARQRGSQRGSAPRDRRALRVDDRRGAGPGAAARPAGAAPDEGCRPAPRRLHETVQ